VIKSLQLRVVVENFASQADANVWAQHGLCLFLDMDLGSSQLKILVDTGTSSEVTLHNADALKLDLDDLDKNFSKPWPL
jgi:metal-dependent hydrolase (beta-lactamase superfamily II)